MIVIEGFFVCYNFLFLVEFDHFEFLVGMATPVEFPNGSQIFSRNGNSSAIDFSDFVLALICLDFWWLAVDDDGGGGLADGAGSKWIGQ